MNVCRAAMLVAALSLSACNNQLSHSSKTLHNTGGGQKQGDRPYELHPDADRLTYYKDIKPLMDEKCAVCHAAGGIVFPLADYQTVYKLKAPIRSSLAAGRMPKYLSADGHQVYQDELRFTNEEYSRYLSWLDKGAVQGDVKDYVPGTPIETDLDSGTDIKLFTAEKAYLPDQKHFDDYRCFIVDSPLMKDTFLTAFQTFPGNKAIVHHLVAYRVEKDIVDTLKKLDEEEDGMGYQCFGGALPDRLSDPALQKRLEQVQPGIISRMNSANYFIAGWAPGVRKVQFPAGTGVSFKQGDAFVIQMHYYSPNAPGVADSGTSFRFQTADNAIPAVVHSLTKQEWFTSRDTGALVIEPNTTPVFKETRSLKTIAHEAMTTLGLDAKDYKSIVIHNANIHMHAVGLNGITYLEDQQQNKEVYLDIPNWDLHWQKNFWFATPKTINLDDADRYSLSVVCQYQNQGSSILFGGFGSYDEMCINFSYITFSKELAPVTERPKPENRKPALSVQTSQQDVSRGDSLDLSLKLEAGYAWGKPGESEGFHYHVAFDSEDKTRYEVAAWQDSLSVTIPSTLAPGKNHYVRISLNYADHDPVGVEVRIPLFVK